MNENWLIVPILTAMAGGASLFLPVFRQKRTFRELYTLGVTLLTSVLLWMLVLNRPADGLLLLHFTGDLNLTLRLDGFKKMDSGTDSIVWM